MTKTKPEVAPILVDIAARAIDADEAEIILGMKKDALQAAYKRFKARRGLMHVEHGTKVWEAMMTSTKPYYEEVEKAKRDTYNAKRRVRTAIDRYRRASVDQSAEAA